jgi:hypothetical protein
MFTQPIAQSSRQVSLGEGLASIPESLLLAHASGQVLFVVGAGVSCQAGLPNYRELVRGVYRRLDAAAYNAMTSGPEEASAVTPAQPLPRSLTSAQRAEIGRFAKEEYDVVLGMLERRIDSGGDKESQVRQAIAEEIRERVTGPAPIHKALMRLADRGQVSTIITTNFDLLLEAAASGRRRAQRYSLGEIPRPTYRPDFSGVLHIHGAFDRDPSRAADLVVTDQDFGEFYLRQRLVPDFLYDAARLFSLVLVGYAANDPPMRYLLNAVAADSLRFDDLRARYAFVPVPEGRASMDVETEMATWRGRGITPIRYAQGTAHEALCKSLQRWAKLSAINGEPRHIEAEVRRIVRKKPEEATESDRDLLAHLIRRGNPREQQELATLASKCKAHIGWLDAIHDALASGSSR